MSIATFPTSEEITQAIVEFRDAIKQRVRDGEPLGNLFEAELRFYGALRADGYEDGMRLSTKLARLAELENKPADSMPRDAIRALIKVLNRAGNYGTATGRLELFEAMDEALLEMTAPDNLTPAQREIWNVVVESGRRQTTNQIFVLLQRAGLQQGKPTLKQNLATLSKRLKVLPNRRDTKRPGYGLPHWD